MKVVKQVYCFWLFLYSVFADDIWPALFPEIRRLTRTDSTRKLKSLKCREKNSLLATRDPISCDLFNWDTRGSRVTAHSLTTLQNNQTINSYYSLGPEQGAAFYTSLHITGRLRSSPSDCALLIRRSKSTIFCCGVNHH